MTRFSVSILSLFLTVPAFAQDVIILPTAGVYPLGATFPVDATRICFEEVDEAGTGVRSLGCTEERLTPDASGVVTVGERRFGFKNVPAGSQVALVADVLIENPGHDVKIAPVAFDASGNRAQSERPGVVDFTPPTPPLLLQIGVAVREVTIEVPK